jgi:beta-glucanase (GH16 family)
VVEVLGHEPERLYAHLHVMDHGQKHDIGHSWAEPDTSSNWHRFGVDWSPQALVWYVDGVEAWRFTDSGQIPAEPMYLLANLAVGGDWPGAPDHSTPFPSTLQIDYVRVWQRG